MAWDATALRSGRIHFFYCLADAIRDQTLLKRYRALLDAAERAKMERYVFERDRRNCLITRAMIRYVLSVGTGTPPAAFQFATNAYGRPELVQDSVQPPIRFNISHSHGITACAVTLGNEIGVDIEHHREEIDLGLADRYFAPRESDYVRSRPAAAGSRAFFDIWTLKEAYIKARGLGLSIPLDLFGFEVGPPTRIHMDAALDDTPDRWRFFQFTPEPEYHAAIAVQSDMKADLQLSIYKCIPLVSAEEV